VMTRGSIFIKKKATQKRWLPNNPNNRGEIIADGDFFAIYDCYIRNNVYLCKGNDDYRNDEYYLNYEVLR
jgi:hypothetical protein